MNIKIKEITEGCMPEIIKVGDWIDLKAAKDIHLRCPHAKTLHRYKNGEEPEKLRDVIFESTLIPLGVAIQIPEGYEAYIVPRSSSFKKYGIIQSNSIGIVDNLYCGDTDEWKMPVIAIKDVTIPKGTRIAQFRIQLSQKATVWQKIKWLFSNQAKLIKVSSLNTTDRGGFGSTGE